MPGKTRQRWWGDACLLLALVLAVCWPWLSPHFQWELPDAKIHLVRVYFMADALARGDFYPRWFPDLYYGYGYPLLSFYAPGLYYLAAPLHLAGATVYAALQWVGAACVAAGAAGTYLLGRAVTGRRESGLLAAAGYVLAPYPFLTNLYVRGAVPEAMGLGLLPWLLLAVWHGRALRRPWLALVAVLLAALVLTHNITALLAAACGGLWILVVSWLPGGRGRRSLAALSGACLAGIGLSAFFWLPAIWEIRQTQYDLLKETLFRWDVRLFDPLRVVGAVAQPDYPHTRLGPADLSPVFSYQALNRSAPEKIALAQLLLWLFALAGTVAAFARRQMLAGGLAACLTGLALGCWWLNTTWSQPVWAHLPLIEFAQYPWRLYGPLALSTALAAGVVLAALPPGGLRLAGRVVAGGLVLLLAVGSLAARPAELGPLPPHDVNGRNQAESERNYYGAGTTTGGEYLPPTVSIAQYDPRIPRGLKVYEEAYPQVTWQAGLVHLLRGEGAVTQVGAGRTWVAARVEASQPLALGIHQLWFPGWRGFVDGQEVPLHTAPYDEQRQASLGFMVLEVPPGTHQVEVRLGPTPLRQAGTFVTWATLGLAGAWWLRLRVWPAPATVPALLTAAGLGLLLGLGAVVLQGWRALPWPGGAIPGARVAVDVAAAIGQGKVEVRSPAGSSRAWQPPYVDQRWLTIGGETRRWLGLHPPAEVAVSLRVPAGAYLQAALGIDPEVWERPTGDGVRFVLEAERRHQGTREVVWARGVNPRARGEDRRWLDVWVSLAHLAGQEVTLILRTEPRDDATFDWAGWANPQVVVWDAPPLSPAAAREQGALS